MCGIAGFIGSGSRSDLLAMTKALAHRGPDDENFHIGNGVPVFLGHRRLTIIDAATGAQPMSNGDGSLTIVFNGEIYNHRTLRRELEALGARFSTDHSDTEVILRGYEIWGDDVVRKLDGMFAFAIWDERQRRLFLGRDRLGEKPLFYMHCGKTLLFSSELPSLRCHPLARAASVDVRGLQKFLAHSFLPGRTTPFKGIRKLLPGSILSFLSENGQLQENRYFRFSIESENPPSGTIDDWTEHLGELVRDAVKSRLESDVPVGVFLSGGIDSSAIAALASQILGPQELSTFTIGFDQKSYDESRYAAVVAERINSRHHMQICDFEYMLRASADVLERLGEPLGDASIIPTFMLSEYAARHVKVALGGDGADELFAGYDPFKALRLARAYDALVPRPVHRALRLVAARLPSPDINMSFAFRLDRTTRGLSFPPQVWNPVWLGALDPSEISRIFGEPVAIEELYSEAIDIWESSTSRSIVDRTLEFFTNLYLPDDILVKTDRAGMMNSLEVRAPFLSNDLIDFVRRLPHNVKYRSGKTKWILKRALLEVLSQETINRRKKGFGIPLSELVRRLPASDWRSFPPQGAELFRTWDDEHRSRQRDHRSALWCALVLDRTVENAGSVNS